MNDGTVRLERLDPRHLDGLAALGQDPDVQKYTYVPVPWPEGFERTWPEAGHAEEFPACLVHDRETGVRALRLVTDWALGELGLERIELRIAPDNAPSIKVAERVGYVREGVLRSVHFKQGQRTDLAIYSRLASDPA